MANFGPSQERRGMVSVDQSTLDDEHFAYCYDKPRKTDVEKLSRFEAEYKSQQDTGKHNCFCDHGGPDCDICGERIKKDIEKNANQRMLEALHDVMNNHKEVEKVRHALECFVIGQRGRLRAANSARIAYEKELRGEIERLGNIVDYLWHNGPPREEDHRDDCGICGRINGNISG